MWQTKIKESSHFLKQRIQVSPQIAIVLGSGLGRFIEHVTKLVEIPYIDIPHFLTSSVHGHKGTLIQAVYNNVEVLILNGRIHYYEGYSMQEMTFPIQVLHSLGVTKLILSNAAGGLNPTFTIGEVMLIKDHLNFMGNNPLIGKKENRSNSRFVSMDEPYSRRIITLASKIAEQKGFNLQKGVYAALSGPYYGTPSESKALYIMGADAVGMSTIPENMVAKSLKMEVFAISVITDLAIVGMCDQVSHEEVLQAATKASPIVLQLLYELLPQL